MSDIPDTSEITVTTKDNELTLEEMSEALPDTATIMTRVRRVLVASDLRGARRQLGPC